jgi:hypothetical protein
MTNASRAIALINSGVHPWLGRMAITAIVTTIVKVFASAIAVMMANTVVDGRAGLLEIRSGLRSA